MKVIFLDFDGVLNSERYVKNSGQFGVIIDPSRMELLKKIVDATEAKIVLSTSWREHWDKASGGCDKIGLQINEIFGEFGLDIFDKTPELNLRREQQIECWLAEHPDVDKFVVLDDEFLSAPFMTGHFVKTSGFREGIDEKNAAEAIKVLQS